MYEISAFGHFDAAHFLRGYPGKCANIHGHRWKVEITLQGVNLNQLGILIDFMEVKRMLKEVVDMFDHKMINDVPPFDSLNPTAENITKFVFDEMSGRLKSLTGDSIGITRVTVWESDAACAAYYLD
ncbi:MAG: 6-carboxytetrahydropterin synthase QueD [Firmicutes bacterium]|nr:6-carboxytetrahydropterin synthase QueD [Bacillota bacterium]